MRKIRSLAIAAVTVGLLAGSAAAVTAQSDDPMAPAEVTGTLVEGAGIQEESEGSWGGTSLGLQRDEPEGGAYEWTDPEVYLLTLDVSDPRLAGDVIVTSYYRHLATTRQGYFTNATWEVTNDGGRWLGTETGVDSELISDGSPAEGAVRIVELTGQAGYEGLSARLVNFDNIDRVVGAIIPGEMPPHPDPYVAE